MIDAANQAYWEKYKLIGVSLYQSGEHESPQTFILPRWRQLQDNLKTQQIAVIAYQPMGASITTHGKSVQAQIVGVEPDLFAWLGTKLQSGRFLSKVDDTKKIVVSGHAVASDLFIINQKEVLSTVGVLESIESSPWFDFDINQCLFVPLTTLPRLGASLDPTSLLLKYQDQDIESVQETFQTFFRSYAKSSLFFQNPQSWDLLQGQIRLFHEIIWLFSFFMVLLGLIFIVQMMNALLTQRRYELGVRMALGASATDCMRYMMAQVFLLTITASAIGFVVSLMITGFLATLYSWPWIFSLLGLMMHFGLIFISLCIVRFQLRKIYQSMPYEFLTS